MAFGLIVGACARDAPQVQAPARDAGAIAVVRAPVVSPPVQPATRVDEGAPPADGAAREASAPPLAHAAAAHGYAADVRAHRAAWERRGPRDYELVVDLRGRGDRVVVRSGEVASVQGVFSEQLARGRALTMADVFDLVEEAARSGRGGVLARFEVTYDRQHQGVRTLYADPRGGVADDEISLQVVCYSTRPGGCRGLELSAEQCGAARGNVLKGETRCDGYAAGRVAGGGTCCTPRDARLVDDECTRAGGRVAFGCALPNVTLASMVSPGQHCCRALFADR